MGLNFNKLEGKSLYGFTYRDIVENRINSYETIYSESGNRQDKFRVEKGRYVIADFNSKQYYYINLE